MYPFKYISNDQYYQNQIHTHTNANVADHVTLSNSLSCMYIYFFSLKILKNLLFTERKSLIWFGLIWFSFVWLTNLTLLLLFSHVTTNKNRATAAWSNLSRLFDEILFSSQGLGY